MKTITEQASPILRSFVSVLLGHRVCLHVLLSVCLFLSLARSLVDGGRRSARCDQQMGSWELDGPTACVVNKFFLCAYNRARSHLFYLPRRWENFKRRGPLLVMDRCGAVLPSCGQ